MAITTESDVFDELAGSEPDYETEPSAPPDEEQVDRLLRHLRRVRREKTATTDVFEAEIARVRHRLDQRLEVLVNQERHLEAQLALFHEARLAEDPKAKTIHLPSGTLKARAQQPEWVWPDDADLVAALTHIDPELVTTQVVKKVSKADLKKALTPAPGAPGETVPVVAGDEVVPGVEVTYRAPKFTAEPDDPGDLF